MARPQVSGAGLTNRGADKNCSKSYGKVEHTVNGGGRLLSRCARHAQGRNVFQHFIRNLSSLITQMLDGVTEVDGVPVNDGTDHQIEAGSAECLAVERAIANFSAFVEEHGTFSLCAASPLLSPAWHRRRKATLEYHSIMNNVRSRRPSSRSALAS